MYYNAIEQYTNIDMNQLNGSLETDCLISWSDDETEKAVDIENTPKAVAIYSISTLLNTNNYIDLYNSIDKYDNIDNDDINRILGKHYNVHGFVVKIMEKIINRKCNLSDANIVEILSLNIDDKCEPEEIIMLLDALIANGYVITRNVVVTFVKYNKYYYAYQLVHRIKMCNTIETILEKIILNGYNMLLEDYVLLINNTLFNGYTIKSPVILKNFCLISDDDLERCKRDRLIKIYYNRICFDIETIYLLHVREYINETKQFGELIEDPDVCERNKKSLENILHMLILIKKINQVKELIKIAKIVVSENFLRYAFNKTVYKYIKSKIMTNGEPIIQKIEDDELFTELLKCADTNDIDATIGKINKNNKNDNLVNNCKIIVFACRNNLDYSLIEHLIRVYFSNEFDAIEIIKSYTDNKNIHQLLLLLHNVGYQFKKQHYIEMFHSPHYYELIDKTYAHDLIFDDDLLISAYNMQLKYVDDLAPKNKRNLMFEKFLNNVAFLCDNINNVENYVAMHCSIGKLSSNAIRKIIKKHEFVLTTKCLLYLYKKTSNINKTNIEYFKKDKVKPDISVYQQYIDLHSVNSVNKCWVG